MEELAEIVGLVVDGPGVQDKDKGETGVRIMPETYIKDVGTVYIELGL